MSIFHKNKNVGRIENTWYQDYTPSVNSESVFDNPAVYSGDEISNDSNAGHKVPVFLGYGVNPARVNGADIEPIPITPVRGQNWPGMQIQLLNGWQRTNYGAKISYDDYLRMLSHSQPGKSYMLPNSTMRRGTSPVNIEAALQAGPGAQPTNPGYPGALAASLAGRTYYG